LKNLARALALPLQPFNCSTVFMSQHRSLKGASTIAARRNVLKRFERVELLKKRGQWKKDSKVIGLPKTKPDV
jgi:small basic protein (TIGR04137 family)